MKEKKWVEAEAAYKQAARLAQKNPVLHTKLGIALSAQQKDAEAEAQHREAVRIEPNKGLWHFNLGVVLDRQGKVVEAEAELREAVRLDPKNVQYRGTWKKVSDSLAAKTPEDPGSKNDQRPPPSGPAFDPVGVWSIEVRTPQGNLLVGFKLSREGQRLTGTFIAQTGTSPIQNASISGNQIRFTTNVKVRQDSIEATLTGSIKDNLISGMLAIPGRGSFEFSGSKAK